MSATHDNTSEARALGLGLAAVLLWSTVATGFKLGLNLMTVSQLLWLGTLISWAIFGIAAAWRKKWQLPREEWPLCVLLGLINPCSYYLLLFAAYDRLPAFIAQPLNYTWAITLALLAVPILKQNITRALFAGICISYAGVVWLLVGARVESNVDWDGFGVALALISTLLWAIYWLLNTRSRAEPVAMMFWSFSLAVPTLTVIVLLGPGLPPLTDKHLLYGGWVGLLEMGVTFLLWQRAMKSTANVGRLGQLIFLAPFLSMLLIYFVLSEPITWTTIAALAVIVAGVLITQRVRVT
ncbi:MAG: DMT family transporter [Pseudomonadota bacterium]